MTEYLKNEPFSVPVNTTAMTDEEWEIKTGSLCAKCRKKICLIPLTRGYNAIVDEDDFEELSRFKWHARPDGRGKNQTIYASRGNRGKAKPKPTTLNIHREILGVTDPKIHVDHIDCDGLNNHRCNLRVCTPSQNQQNKRKRSDDKVRSKYKGVSIESNGRITARIGGNKDKRELGSFGTAEEAARAYDEAAKAQFGEFARLNFPATEA